jgi:hypothetical protein
MARIQFHEAGFEALLTSAATKAVVKKPADAMAEKANAVASTTDPAATEPYYEVEDGTTDRARYRVATAQGDQLKRNVRHEAKTQALQKSI